MLKKNWIWIFAAITLVIFMFFSLPVQKIIYYTNFLFSSKDSLLIDLAQAGACETLSVSAEPSNKLIFRVRVKNSAGSPVPMVRVAMRVEGNMGSFSPDDFWTGMDGESLVVYTPPELDGERLAASGIDVSLTAGIFNTDKKSSVKIRLVRVPVILVHGYQEKASVFDNMKEYLSSKGFSASALDYNSPSGVIASSAELGDFLARQRKAYLSKGVKVNKFDIVAHSMGGIVARYYSCSREYIFRDDIRKIIFISVPQKGSPWASLGMTYYNDQGIKDLVPDNPLFTAILPSLLNKGLNNTIEVGSIIAEFDEVVSPESASLAEWNIETEVFNVGENSFTVENILSGNIIHAVNHKNILNNKKAFETIEKMLNSKLPYPFIRK